MLFTMLIVVAIKTSAASPPEPVATNDPLILMFERNGTEMEADGSRVLSDFAAAFRSPDDPCYEIIGHSDFAEGSGEAKYNLSKRRADVTKRILVASGVPREAITARGVSDWSPIAPKSHRYNQFVSIMPCTRIR